MDDILRGFVILFLAVFLVPMVSMFTGCFMMLCWPYILRRRNRQQVFSSTENAQQQQQQQQDYSMDDLEDPQRGRMEIIESSVVTKVRPSLF